MVKDMRRAMIAAGAKETFVDCFEMSNVDYATVEQRIMEAMREPGTAIAPPVSGDSNEETQ